MYSKEFNNCYILLSNISQALENTKFIQWFLLFWAGGPAWGLGGGGGAGGAGGGWGGGRLAGLAL